MFETVVVYMAKNITEGANILARVHMQFNNITHKVMYVHVCTILPYALVRLLLWYQWGYLLVISVRIRTQDNRFSFQKKIIFLSVKYFFIMYSGKHQDSEVSPFPCLPQFILYTKLTITFTFSKNKNKSLQWLVAFFVTETDWMGFECELPILR